MRCLPIEPPAVETLAGEARDVLEGDHCSSGMATAVPGV